jgi:hypothetical protein
MAECFPGNPRNVELPLSSACHDGICGGCDGYTDGYSTYHCGHRCHWCPSGDHYLGTVRSRETASPS